MVRSVLLPAAVRNILRIQGVYSRSGRIAVQKPFCKQPLGRLVVVVSVSVSFSGAASEVSAAVDLSVREVLLITSLSIFEVSPQPARSINAKLKKISDFGIISKVSHYFKRPLVFREDRTHNLYL